MRANRSRFSVNAAVAERARLTRLGQGAAVGPHLVLALVVDVSFPGLDQVDSPAIEPVEIIRGKEQVFAPVEAEPTHVALDGVDIFLLFLGRIGVVETQMTAAAKLLRNAEIQADRLGVADVQIAVRFRWEPGHDLLHAAGFEIAGHDVPDEIEARFVGCRAGCCLVVCRHAFSTFGAPCRRGLWHDVAPASMSNALSHFAAFVVQGAQ